MKYTSKFSEQIERLKTVIDKADLTSAESVSENILRISRKNTNFTICIQGDFIPIKPLRNTGHIGAAIYS